MSDDITSFTGFTVACEGDRLRIEISGGVVYVGVAEVLAALPAEALMRYYAERHASNLLIRELLGTSRSKTSRKSRK